MGKEKSINKVLIWQTGAQFLLQGLSFFTAPIFTRLMTPADYGQLSTYLSWVNLVGLFVGLRTYQTIALAKLKFEGQEFNRYLSSIMTISLLSFLLIFPFALIFQIPIGRLLGFPSFIIPVIVLHCFFSYCISFYSAFLIQLKKIEKNVLISIFQAVSIIILSLIIVRNTDKNKYIGKIVADFSVILLLGFFLFTLIMYRGKVFFNKDYWYFCLPLCIPLIFHGIGSVILAQSDRVMLKAMVGETETGIYSVVYTLALVVNVIRNSCDTVWVPFYFEDKKKGNVATIRKRSINYLILFTIITIGFILLAPEVFKFLAPEAYWRGIKIIPLVAMAYYLNFLYTFPSNYEFYKKKVNIIATGTTIVAVLNIGLNFLLIPKYAGLGAAIATLLSFALSFLIHDFNVRFIIQASDFEYNFLFYVKGILPVCIISVIYYVFADFWYVRWALGFILGLSLLLQILKRRSIF